MIMVAENKNNSAESVIHLDTCFKIIKQKILPFLNLTPQVSYPKCNLIAVEKCVDLTDTDAIARLSNKYDVLSKIQKRREKCLCDSDTAATTASFTEDGSHKGSVGIEFDSTFTTEGSKMQSCIRSALARYPPTGRIESIHLEYIEGVSLKEWLVRLNQKRIPAVNVDGNMKHDLLERVKIAHAVAKSVAEVHELGLVHNDVTLSNFIVTDEHISATKNEQLEGEAQDDLYEDIWNTMVEKDEDEEATDTASDDDVKMKIINFGYAVQQSSMETVDTGGIVNDDIPALAEVSRLLFTDSISFDDNEEETYDSDLGFGGNSGFGRKVLPARRPKHTQLSNLPASILAILQGLPHSIITTSITHEHADFNSSFRQFPSAREVELMFAQLLENPDRFLFGGTPTAGGPSNMLMAESIQGNVVKRQEKGVTRNDELCHSSTKLNEIDAGSAEWLNVCSHIFYSIGSSSLDNDQENRERPLKRSVSESHRTSKISSGRSMSTCRNGISISPRKSTGSMYVQPAIQKPSRKQKKVMKVTLKKIQNGLLCRRQRIQCHEV